MNAVMKFASHESYAVDFSEIEDEVRWFAANSVKRPASRQRANQRAYAVSELSQQDRSDLADLLEAELARL